MYLQLQAEDGEEVSTAEVDDQFWMAESAAIKARVRASFPGFGFYELSPVQLQPFEVDHKVGTMVDVDNWVASLDDPA
jgi:hypothetical protein